MRQELQSPNGSLSGQLHIGAIPTTLPFVPHLTVPFHTRYPAVRLSATSAGILARLENLELEIGISYIENEPIGRLSAVDLYEEQYMLLVSARSPLAQRKELTWSEVGKLPLCLLTADTQTRRVIDEVLERQGGLRAPTFESNSIDPHLNIARGERRLCPPSGPIAIAR